MFYRVTIWKPDSIIFIHQIQIFVSPLEIQKSLPKKQCVHHANSSWMFTRQFFVILVIPLLLCSTIDSNAHVSSQSTTTVYQTKHTLNIIYGTGTADNAPDPCVPSLCYMSAYLHAFRLHTREQPIGSSL